MIPEYLNIALTQIGAYEYKNGDNPEIIKYFMNNKNSDYTDEIPWCAAFVNWCLSSGGFEYSGLLQARSYLNVGYHVPHPQLGDVAIFWRGDKHSWKGHVGFYINKVGHDIYILGGNQSDAVSIAPYHESQLIDFRRVRKIV